MQRVYWNWKDADLTADLNAWMHGIMPAGLYRGFDKGATSTGWTLILDHAVNGYTRVDEGLIVSQLTGIIKSPQGSIISENDSISLPVQPADAAPRYDIVVCSHQHLEVIGGQPAVYSVVKGTPSNGAPQPPTVANVATDVIIGIIAVPANAASINNCTYTKSTTPTFANTPQGIPFSQKGSANGVATLGADSYVNSLVPSSATDLLLSATDSTNLKAVLNMILGRPVEHFFLKTNASGGYEPLIILGHPYQFDNGRIGFNGNIDEFYGNAGKAYYKGKIYPIVANSGIADQRTIIRADPKDYLPAEKNPYLKFNEVLVTIDKNTVRDDSYFEMSIDDAPRTVFQYWNCLCTLEEPQLSLDVEATVSGINTAVVSNTNWFMHINKNKGQVSVRTTASMSLNGTDTGNWILSYQMPLWAWDVRIQNYINFSGAGVKVKGWARRSVGIANTRDDLSVPTNSYMMPFFAIMSNTVNDPVAGKYAIYADAYNPSSYQNANYEMTVHVEHEYVCDNLLPVGCPLTAVL